MGPLRPKLSGEMPKQSQVPPKQRRQELRFHKAAPPSPVAEALWTLRCPPPMWTPLSACTAPGAEVNGFQWFPTASMGCQSLKVHHSPKADPASVVRTDVPDLDGSAGELKDAEDPGINGAWNRRDSLSAALGSSLAATGCQGFLLGS